ncbi:hypothetical protein BGX20_001684 [Mortierella sp. AD010]|nr:hypothetical protein BGX20_001684 [Mortierella sp. AD010]
MSTVQLFIMLQNVHLRASVNWTTSVTEQRKEAAHGPRQLEPDHWVCPRRAAIATSSDKNKALVAKKAALKGVNGQRARKIRTSTTFNRPRPSSLLAVPSMLASLFLTFLVWTSTRS